MENLTIGKLAKIAGVKIGTVRYYEKRGLLPKPARRDSGYRQYTQETVERISLIRHAKGLGFSLREIHELLSLKFDLNASCSDVRSRAVAKLSDIEERIEALRKMKKSLLQLTKTCGGTGPVSKCSILEALEK